MKGIHEKILWKSLNQNELNGLIIEAQLELKKRGVIKHGGKRAGEISEELEPCPFCGSKILVVHTFDYNSIQSGEVVCMECECSGPWGAVGKCRELWNNRAIGNKEVEGSERE